jgi:hypothetical protein
MKKQLLSPCSQNSAPSPIAIPPVSFPYFEVILKNSRAGGAIPGFQIFAARLLQP